MQACSLTRSQTRDTWMYGMLFQPADPPGQSGAIIFVASALLTDIEVISELLLFQTREWL